ncbi:MAG: hemolysin family protein [Candidatus Nanopelagicales bacterium]
MNSYLGVIVGAVMISLIIGYIIARSSGVVAGYLRMAFEPISNALMSFGNVVIPGAKARKGKFSTDPELREFVDKAEAADIIEDDERQMIQSVIDLGDTLAREVMVPRTDMVWIESTKTARQALSLCSRSGFSRIPVVGEDLDDVVGILFLKDIVKAELTGQSGTGNTYVTDLMRTVHRVPESKRVDDVLSEMQAEHNHLVLVIDEYGGTAGLVTIEDIVEEIVGEIADEHDQGEIPEAVEVGPGVWRVNTRMQLDDFAELTGLGVSEEVEDVDSVGGLLAHRLGVVPIPGSTIQIDNFQILAESGTGRRNRVATVLVTAQEPTDAHESLDAKPDESESHDRS